MAKEEKIVKVVGYSIYPNLDIEKDGVRVTRQVFECRETDKSYIVLSPEDKSTLASRFSLYNGIIPKDKCERTSQHYNRYAFDERMYMFTTDFDNEREFVEHGISTYYTLRCTKLEDELKRVRDVRAKALDSAKEQGFIGDAADENIKKLDAVMSAVGIGFAPDESKKEPAENESTNPCDWCRHGYGVETCPIGACYGWSRFDPVAGTPLFIEQKVDDMHDSFDW